MPFAPARDEGIGAGQSGPPDQYYASWNMGADASREGLGMVEGNSEKPPSPTNIFVIHTPLQHLIVSQMVMGVPEFKSVPNILVLDMPSDNLDIDRSLWSEVLPLKPPVGRYFIGDGGACRRARNKIKSLIDNNGWSRLFVSDIEWPLNNALYGLRHRYEDSRVEICNFPDGLGSLLVRYPRFKRRLRSLAKKLIGLLGGLPYSFYRGDIMGLAACDAVYSLLPSALPAALNSRINEIPLFKPRSANIIPDSCLFLGQTYEYHFPPEEHLRLCQEAADFAQKLGYKTNFYKPHHFAKSETEKNIFLERDFELFEDPRPAEAVFMERQLSCVVSYNSSALVHLKMMFGEKVRCISCFNTWCNKYTITGETSLKSVIGLFDMCGVEIYDSAENNSADSC